MMIVVSILGALLPSFLLLWFFYSRDLNPEPRGVLIKTFLLGVLSVIPVVVIATPFMLLAPNTAHPLLVGLWTAFLCAAFPEELCKFLVLWGYSSRQPAFDEPMDGVVYGATASLGFATLENILYVMTGGWTVALIRAFTAVPSHACGGAIMGYFVGQARFNSKSKLSTWAGLVVAALLHGLYDFPLLAVATMEAQGMFANEFPAGQEMFITALLSLVLIVMLAEVIWTWLIVRHLRQEQLQLAAAAQGEGTTPTPPIQN